MRVRTLTAIDEVSPEAWNARVPGGYPFLRHEFLAALEHSGSVGGRSGWQPAHLVAEDAAGALIAALPLYAKAHSFGEYVFDSAWANAYARHGLAYYPKLVSAVPFTPASGPRLLLPTDDDAKETPLSASVLSTFAEVLNERCLQRRASGWHVLFPREAEYWQHHGALVRNSVQFHWQNEGFRTFDEFLATFTSKRRKTARRERARVYEQGVRLERQVGAAITEEVWHTVYQCYQATYLKRSGHGGYLTPQFFEALHETLCDQLMVVAAFRAGRCIAAALHLMSDDTLFGRYWGALDEVDCLHFEACYYQGIEFCIERGLSRFDPGAQGEHKIARGFRPVITRSCHRLMHPAFHDAIARFLEEERVAVDEYHAAATAHLPFREAGESPAE